MKISFAIEIESAPEVVYSWLADPERAKVWMTSVTKTEVLNKTEDWVGTTFRETIEDENGATTLRGVVTRCCRNQLISIHLEGDYNVVDVDFRLEDVDGRTRLTENAEVRFKSFARFAMFFLGPLFRKKILKQYEKEVVALKKICEESATA